MTNNEKIARFMGDTLDKDGFWIHADGGISSDIWYDSQWNWLMPVVERINEPEVKKGKIIRSAADVQILYKACRIQYSPDEDFEDREEKEINCSGETKKEAVYKAVVQFIDWYEQQPKP